MVLGSGDTATVGGGTLSSYCLHANGEKTKKLSIKFRTHFLNKRNRSCYHPNTQK